MSETEQVISRLLTHANKLFLARRAEEQSQEEAKRQKLLRMKFAEEQKNKDEHDGVLLQEFFKCVNQTLVDSEQDMKQRISGIMTYSKKDSIPVLFLQVRRGSDWPNIPCALPLQKTIQYQNYSGYSRAAQQWAKQGGNRWVADNREICNIGINIPVLRDPPYMN